MIQNLLGLLSRPGIFRASWLPLDSPRLCLGSGLLRSSWLPCLGWRMAPSRIQLMSKEAIKQRSSHRPVHVPKKLSQLPRPLNQQHAADHPQYKQRPKQFKPATPSCFRQNLGTSADGPCEYLLEELAEYLLRGLGFASRARLASFLQELLDIHLRPELWIQAS